MFDLLQLKVLRHQINMYDRFAQESMKIEENILLKYAGALH